MQENWMNVIDESGSTPLERAFACGHRSLVELLMEQEQQDKAAIVSGDTPLHRAACLGLVDAIQSLATFGGDVNVEDQQGELPLHKAVRAQAREAVAYLSEYSNVNHQSNSGMTPLHWAALMGDQEMLHLLVEKGGDPWLRSSSLDDLSPMGIATAMGYTDVAEDPQLRQAMG